MKKMVFFALIIGTSLLYAEYVEVRDAYGTRSGYSRNANLYVCYNERVRVFSEGVEYLSYRGCSRKHRRCRHYGKVHFGKYPNNAQASRALSRCRNSRPRFVD